MTRTGFIFISALLLLFAIFNGAGGVDVRLQAILSLSAIALLGIPHGAIDHIIYLDGSRKANTVRFYAMYLGLIALYIVAWVIAPLWSLVGFMVLSAYHFGESQFSDFVRIPSRTKFVLAAAWGCSILSGMVVYNHGEIMQLAANYPDMAKLIGAFHLEAYRYILPASTTVALGLLLYAWRGNMLKGETLLREIYVLGLIHLCFFLLPLIVGFTLYFTVLHSFKVLTEEFSYLKKRYAGLSVTGFVRKLAPYTLVSVAGAGLFILLAETDILNVSSVLLLFILISVLTLPHSFVMNDFYRRFFG